MEPYLPKQSTIKRDWSGRFRGAGHQPSGIHVVDFQEVYVRCIEYSWGKVTPFVFQIIVGQISLLGYSFHHLLEKATKGRGQTHNASDTILKPRPLEGVELSLIHTWEDVPALMTQHCDG